VLNRFLISPFIDRPQINNTAAGTNSAARDMPVIRNNMDHTNAIADYVSVLSVPNPFRNTIGELSTFQI